MSKLGTKDVGAAHTRGLAVFEGTSADEAARILAKTLCETLEAEAAYVALAKGDGFEVNAVEGDRACAPDLGSMLQKTAFQEPTCTPWGSDRFAIFVPLGEAGIAVAVSRTKADAETLSIARAVGAPARIAFAERRALDEARELVGRQRALVELQRALGSAHLEDAFPSFVTRLAAEMSFDLAWLGSISTARDEIAIVACHPIDGDAPRTGTTQSFSDSSIAPILRDRDVRAAGPSYLDRATAASIAPWAASGVLVPLVAQDALIGVLVLLARNSNLSAPTLPGSAQWLLATTAEPLSMALENAALFARLRDTMQDWQTTFDVMDALVLIADDRDTIRRANRALARCMRTNAAALVGRPVASLFPGQPMPTPIDMPRTDLVGPRGEPFRASAVALPGGGVVIVVHEQNSSAPPRSQSYSALRKISTGQQIAMSRGKVLVVDDEPSILRAVYRTLSRYHEVVTAADGDEALALLRNANPPFDAVMTDVQMARVSGLELYRTIEKEMPALKDRVLFMTGGVFSGPTEEFLRSLKQRVLRKPFDPDLLRRAIDERVAMSRVA